jgi:hypothetical protein
VRVTAHTTFFFAWRKLMRRSVIKQKEWAELVAKAGVIKNRADRETIADPMHFGTSHNLKQLFHRVFVDYNVS